MYKYEYPNGPYVSTLTGTVQPTQAPTLSMQGLLDARKASLVWHAAVRLGLGSPASKTGSLSQYCEGDSTRHPSPSMGLKHSDSKPLVSPSTALIKEAPSMALWTPMTRCRYCFWSMSASPASPSVAASATKKAWQRSRQKKVGASFTVGNKTNFAVRYIPLPRRHR